MPVIQLNTIDLQATVSTPARPYKRRAFNDQEWQYLNSLDSLELMRRVHWGNRLIELLHHPAMLNMSQKEADYRSSNLNYQIEAIMHIIEERKVING